MDLIRFGSGGWVAIMLPIKWLMAWPKNMWLISFAPLL
jgi:hypothetical protein